MAEHAERSMHHASPSRHLQARWQRASLPLRTRRTTVSRFGVSSRSLDHCDAAEKTPDGDRMGYPLRFGILTFSAVPWAEMVARWRHIEALGFYSAWVGDHYAYPYAPRIAMVRGLDE